MRQGFIFNLNKCVGCHACVAACQIENEGEQHVPWREVNTFNFMQHPDLPVFHYSLACNHCEDAPCLSSCPALAFTKDPSLNTIDHDPQSCIGCKYCTWACPYDAPKFVNTNGVIEKCTLCQHRLKKEQKPACVNLCPTGALDYSAVNVKDQSRITGFTEAYINPAINIVELRKRKPPRSAIHLSDQANDQYKRIQLKSTSKISFHKEWVLVLFTMLVPLLTGFFAAGSLGFFEINPFLFLGVGLFGLALSSLHLGKKNRVWRTVLNLKSSWLSREIIAYGLFLGASFCWFVFPDYIYIAYAAAALGFVTSFVVDKVYLHMDRTTAINLHSSNVFLSSLLFSAFLTNNYRFVILVLGIKCALYIYRKIYFLIHRKKFNKVLFLIRILSSFILPYFYWYAIESEGWFLVFILLFIGELADRIEFYDEGEIITPDLQIIKDTLRMLKN